MRHSIRVPPQPLRRSIHLPLEPTPAPAQEPELASAPEPEMTEQERELLRAGKAGGDAGAARQFVAKPSPDRAHHLLRHVCKVVLQDRAPVRGTNGNYRGRRPTWIRICCPITQMLMVTPAINADSGMAYDCVAIATSTASEWRSDIH